MTHIISLVFTSLLCLMVLPIPHLKAQEMGTNDLTSGEHSLVQENFSSEDIPHITIGNSYTSRVTYWGRNFGVRQYGIYPHIAFTTTKGLFMYATGLYESYIQNRLTETNLGIGYERELTQRFYASVTYERWIPHFDDQFGRRYSRNTLNNYLELLLSYDLGWFAVDPAVHYMFGTEKTFVSDISVNRSSALYRSVSGDVQVSVEPEVLTIFASNSFVRLFGDYRRRFTRDKGFRLSGFEVNAPIFMEFRNLELGLTPHYNIPVQIENERVERFFSFSINLNYNINLGS